MACQVSGISPFSTHSLDAPLAAGLQPRFVDQSASRRKTMAKTAIATLQPVWECRYSRVQSPLSTAADRWICVHGGERRPIAEEECHSCPHWEYGYRTAADDHLTMPKLTVPGRRGLLRGLILLNAAVVLACGFVALNSPVAVPFTISMWLSAAALVGFAVFGPIPAR
jgi:hypothetical protein